MVSSIYTVDGIVPNCRERTIHSLTHSL